MMLRTDFIVATLDFVLEEGIANWLNTMEVIGCGDGC